MGPSKGLKGQQAGPEGSTTGPSLEANEKWPSRPVQAERGLVPSPLLDFRLNTSNCVVDMQVSGS
jgi:hypothetical protein